MRGTRSKIGNASTAFLALVCAWAIGCREELNPARPPTSHVQGRVAFRGEPIGGGWIEFHPIEGALGDVRSAPLNLDGTFVADRVANGLNAIRVAHPTVIPRSVRSIGRIPVAIRLIAGANEALEIDLARNLPRSPRPN